MKDINIIFNKVLKLVKECANILKKVDYEKEIKVKSDGTLVTKYDLMIDKKLTEKLKEILDIPVLSEEHYEELGSTYFVVDPIDGTHNFSRGFECFGIMVALVENNETVFSIVDLPILNKTFTAKKGRGAYLNDNKIQVREVGERFIGCINVTRDETLEWISKLNKSLYKFEFRCLNSSCVSLCYIASGNFDFHIQYGKMGAWDAIVPKLIIEEAGGVCEYEYIGDSIYKVMAGSKDAINAVKEIIES